MNILEALTQASRNRIIQVQLAASRALRAWKGEALSPPKNGLTVHFTRFSHLRKNGMES